MSEDIKSYGNIVHRYKEFDKIECTLNKCTFDAVIIQRQPALTEEGEPTYDIQRIDTGDTYFVSEKMLAPKYGVSYIAAVPEELKVGDRVEVVDEESCNFKRQGEVVCILMDGGVRVNLDSKEALIANPSELRKLHDTILFEEDSDNVKAFKTILNEMAETYKAKDADYGSAYDDGYRLFGHTQLLSRIYEKFSRVKHMLDGNKPNIAENIYDTLTDMAVQAICLRMLLQKNDFENVD